MDFLSPIQEMEMSAYRHVKQGRKAYDQRNLVVAEQEIKAALKIYDDLIDDTTGCKQFDFAVREAHLILGNIFLVNKQHDEAINEYEALENKFQALVDCGQIRFHYELATTKICLGKALFDKRKPKLAALKFESAIKIYTILVNIGWRSCRPELALTYKNLGYAVFEAGQRKEGVNFVQRGADIIRTPASIGIKQYRYEYGYIRFQCARIRGKLGGHIFESGNFAAALIEMKAATVELEAAVAEDRLLLDRIEKPYLQDIYVTRGLVGVCLWKCGNPWDSETHLVKAVDGLESLVSIGVMTAQAPAIGLRQYLETVRGFILINPRK